ncbi:hypothetical protein KC336_g21066, partial [Hortaea werneckii]
EEDIREILTIRAQEEEIDLTPNAVALLTKFGAEAGLRYASNLITTSNLLAQKRKAKEVDAQDVQRSYQLFYDPTRSAKFVSEFEKRFIGEDGGVTLGGSNGVSQGDAMEVS